MSDNLLTIPCTTIKGEQKTLADYAGKAVLVVNTASKCGFTPQYKGLEKLWQDYKDQGLVVLGFTCNQFRKEDPGKEGDISEFCELVAWGGQHHQPLVLVVLPEFFQAFV